MLWASKWYMHKKCHKNTREYAHNPLQKHTQNPNSPHLTHDTQSVCPSKTYKHEPDVASHARTLLSALPEKITPSLVQSTQNTASLCPTNSLRTSARLMPPKAQHLIDLSLLADSARPLHTCTW